MTFSVIMPVYGVEQYLRQGIDSVLTQTFTDFEVILVDDCSPDNCPMICDEYAELDNRVKVIHKPENEGLGEARNTGFAASEGEYIFFIDSDDTVEPNLLQKVYDVLQNGSDIAVFGINLVREYKEGREIRREVLSPKSITAANKNQIGNCFVALSRTRVFPFAWNKVYSKAFLEKCNISFERTKLIEDFLFNIQVFQKAEKITVLNDVLYNYRKPAHQTLASAYSSEFFNFAKRKFALEREFLENMGVANEENCQFVMENHLKHILSTIIRNASKRANLTRKEQKKKVVEILEDHDSKMVLSQFVPHGIQYKVICSVLKTGNPTICIALAKAVDFAKKKG